MLQYIIECIAFQLVFLVIYDLFLKRETFFQWNRAYLMGTYVVSMILPWVKIEAMKTTVSPAFQEYPEFLWNLNDAAFSATATSETSFSISWEYALLFGGMFLAAFLFAYKLYQIYTLKREGEVQFFKDFQQIIIANSNIAFSFFKSIFLGDKVIEKEHQSIVAHELVHIRQRHSYDLLFFELMRIVGWFNPLVYVYQKRVSELHEFIADAQVAKTHKKEQYEQLLSQVFQTEHISFVNQFFKSSLIKKRIVMLQKTKSKKIWQLKYLLLVPMVLGMLAYTSFDKDTINTTEESYQQSPEDLKLIAEIETEIEQEIIEKGTIDKVFFQFAKLRNKQEYGQVLTKRDYFKEALLYRKLGNEIKVEFGDDVKPAKPQPHSPLPSTVGYNAYVEGVKAFQILDKNLRISLQGDKKNGSLAVGLIKKNDEYPQEYYVLNVQNTNDLTGEEIRGVNHKLDVIFQKESAYTALVLTDENYAFKIYRKKQLDPQYKLDTKGVVVRVSNVDALTEEEEKKIFETMSALSKLDIHWTLIVKGDDSKMTFKKSEDGSYLTGPKGERIAAKMAIDSKLNAKEGEQITAFLEKSHNAILNTKTLRYNQLVEERRKLLQSSNEKNPVIVNLDAQIRALKEEMRGFKKPLESIDKTQAEGQYQKLLKERKQLLRSSNENNPIIVNLNEQLDQMRQGIGSRAEVPGDSVLVPFAVVDQAPVFPGCENASNKRNCFNKMLQKHISKNFRYPEEAQDKDIQGRVSVMFTIDAEGNIVNIIKRGPHKSLEDEAVRIISLLPKVEPGVHKGKNVNVPFSIPITFKLQGDFKEIKSENYDDAVHVPFSVVDQVPVFPGCENASNKRDCFNKMFQKHISKNFRYPKEAHKKGIQGRVNVMLTIDEAGKVTNIHKRGPHKLLEDEAVRIIERLPNMTPGKHKGKPVGVPYSIPITFKLQ